MFVLVGILCVINLGVFMGVGVNVTLAITMIMHMEMHFLLAHPENNLKAQNDQHHADGEFQSC